MKRIVVLAAALALAAPLARAADAWRFGVQGDAVHDSNATRGIYDGAKSDNLISVQGDATRSFLLSERSGLVVRGLARYTAFDALGDLDDLALGVRAAWRVQPTLGFGAPWYEIAGEANRLVFPDSDLRDGWLVTAEASVGAYLTDRMRVSGGFGIDKRNGGGTADIFDYTQDRFFGTFDLRVGVNTAFYAKVSRIGGDQVFSSGSHSGGSSVWADDPALRGPLGLSVANIYRIDATTWAYELGLNVPFGPNRSFDFGLARYDAQVNEGLFEGQKYSATVVRASLLYRFQ